MPIVATVEDCEVLADVEIEPLVWWECPLSEVVEVRASRNSESNTSTDDDLTSEHDII